MNFYHLETTPIVRPSPEPDHTPSPTHWTTAQGRRLAYTAMADNHLLSAYRWIVAQINGQDSQRARNRAQRHWRPAHDALRTQINLRHLEEQLSSRHLG